MHVKFLLVFIFVMVLGTSCLAQNYLVLRRNNYNYKQYFPGREITLIVQNGYFSRTISGIIDSISDEIIFVEGEKAYLQNIRKVQVNRKSYNYRTGGTNLMLAGPLLALLCATNDRDMRENKPFYIASGVLFTSGIAMRLHARRTLRIGDKNKLIVISVK